MSTNKISIPETLQRMDKLFSPALVASLNSSSFDIKLAKIKGEFVWHSHPDTDELFYIVEGGPVAIMFRDKPDVELKKGDMFVIPKGVEHCPKSEVETAVMLIEAAGTVNTGDAERSDMTSEVRDVRTTQSQPGAQ